MPSNPRESARTRGLVLLLTTTPPPSNRSPFCCPRYTAVKRAPDVTVGRERGSHRTGCRSTGSLPHRGRGLDAPANEEIPQGLGCRSRIGDVVPAHGAGAVPDHQDTVNNHRRLPRLPARQVEPPSNGTGAPVDAQHV